MVYYVFEIQSVLQQISIQNSHISIAHNLQMSSGLHTGQLANR